VDPTNDNGSEWIEGGIQRGWPTDAHPDGDAGCEVMWWGAISKPMGQSQLQLWWIQTPYPLVGGDLHEIKYLQTGSGYYPWTVYIDGSVANCSPNTFYLSTNKVDFMEVGLECSASSGYYGSFTDPAEVDTIRHTTDGGSHWVGIPNATLTYNTSSPSNSWAGWVSGEEGTHLLNYRKSSD
jgi:hypothetical protein